MVRSIWSGRFPLVLSLLVDVIALLPQRSDMLQGMQGELYPGLTALWLYLRGWGQGGGGNARQRVFQTQLH